MFLTAAVVCFQDTNSDDGRKPNESFSLQPPSIPPIARQPERHGNRVTWALSVVRMVVPFLNTLHQITYMHTQGFPSMHIFKKHLQQRAQHTTRLDHLGVEL